MGICFAPFAKPYTYVYVTISGKIIYILSLMAMIKKSIYIFLKCMSFFSMLPLFKIDNHRASYTDMDNNFYSTDKNIYDILLGIYKNRNMDNKIHNKDKDTVDIPHSMSIA